MRLYFVCYASVFLSTSDAMFHPKLLFRMGFLRGGAPAGPVFSALIRRKQA